MEAMGAGKTKVRAIAARWSMVLRCLPLALLAVVLWREKPWTVELAANAPWAIAAAVLINLVFSVPLKAARWRVALTDPPPFRQVLAATLEGLLASSAIGFGSGDVVRAARLRRSDVPLTPRAASVSEGTESPAADAVSQSHQFAVDYGCTWAERGAEVLALALLVFFTALMTDLGLVALAISSLAAAGYVTLLASGRVLLPRFRRWPRVQRALAAGLSASTPRRVAAMATLSLLGWSVELTMLVLFQRAFELPISVSTALLTLVAINAAIAIPSMPGHFGTYEAGIATVLVLSGTRRDVAVSYALAFHLSHVVPVAVVASAVLLYRSRRFRRAVPAPATSVSGRAEDAAGASSRAET